MQGECPAVGEEELIVFAVKSLKMSTCFGLCPVFCGGIFFSFMNYLLFAFSPSLQDAMRSVTKQAVKEARLKEIKQELLNSEKLKVGCSSLDVVQGVCKPFGDRVSLFSILFQCCRSSDLLRGQPQRSPAAATRQRPPSCCGQTPFEKRA